MPPIKSRADRHAHAQSFGPLETAAVAIGGAAAVVAAGAAGLALSTYREKRATRRLREAALEALYSTARFQEIRDNALVDLQHEEINDQKYGFTDTATAKAHPAVVDRALQMLAASLDKQAVIWNGVYTFHARRSDDGELVLVAVKHFNDPTGNHEIENKAKEVVVWSGKASPTTEFGSPTFV